MADYEFSARLNDSQVLAALKNIDANIEKIAKNGQDSFERISKGANKGAAGLGIVTGASTAVITKLIEMGQAAARAFAEIVKGSVDAAKNLETVETSLTGIFQGNEKAALASLDRIRQESIRLGVDLTELAPAFLPKVESLDQFVKIGELVASLARLDPAQGAAGARLALTEALSGDITSIRRRFEIDTGPIQEAQKELGDLEGLLVGLQQVLEERGQDFNNLADTAAVAFGRTQQIGQDVKLTFGEPILDALKEDFLGLNEFLLENKDSLDLIAGSLGDLLADIADLSGDQILAFIQDLDLEAIQGFIVNLQDAIVYLDTIKNLADQSPFLPIVEDFREWQASNREWLKDQLDVRASMVALIQIMGILNATAAAGIAAVSGYFEIITGIATGEIPFDELSEQVDNLGESIRTAARDAVNAANESITELTEGLDKNIERLEDRADAQDASNQGDIDAANAALANKQALEAEAKAAEEAASAQEKYNDARNEFEIDKQRAADDLTLKQQRALLDAEIEFAQKREDIARKNAQAIEDIYRENAQKITDAAVDLRRDEEDIARKNARSQIEIEREAANRKVEIETDYRRELQRIRERFDFDAQEAIRQNDAIAFLRIQRQKDFELQQAQTQRDEEIQDAETSAIEQRQKLQEQLQGQIEDARIANERKLEDLRVSLERELQEQRAKYARDVQEAKIAEDRKRQELARTFQRQQQDFQIYWDRKLQDLIRNYQREIQIIQQYEAQKARIMAESRARARAAAEAASADSVLLQNYGSGYSPNPNAQQEANSADSVLLQNYSGRKYGGRMSRGIPYLVGENGPELVMPDRGATVYPNYRLRFNPSANGAITQITNTRQTNFNVDALMSMLSPQQLAIVQQLVNQLGMSIYR